MTSIEWTAKYNDDGTQGKTLCISSNARLSSMSQIVALFTERNTVADLESEFRMISKTFNVVSVQIPAPTIATFLTGIAISLKNCFAPVSVLCALSYAPVLWCDTALPEFNLRPSMSICAGLGSKIGKLFWCKWLPFAVLIALLRPAHFLFCFWRMSFALKYGWPAFSFTLQGLTHFLAILRRLHIGVVSWFWVWFWWPWGAGYLGGSFLFDSRRFWFFNWLRGLRRDATTWRAGSILAITASLVISKIINWLPHFAFHAPLFASINVRHVFVEC
jgi:hypothetical protein